MTDTATIRNVLSYGALAFGAGSILAPRAVTRTYGLADPTPEHAYTLRLWGAALCALGAVGLQEDGVDDTRYLQVALAMNTVDTLAALGSGASARSRIMSAATSAAFAAAAAYGLQEG